MPSFNSDLLPASAGFSVGQPLQRWNANLGNVSVNSLSISPVTGFTTPASGIVNVNATPVTANANTTSPQNLMSFSVPAGLLNSLNRVLRVRMAGSYTTQAGQTPSLILRFLLGAQALTQPFTDVLIANSSNYRWSAVLEFIVALAGSSAFIEPISMLTYGQFTATVRDGQALSRIGPIDLTTALTAQVQCTFTTNTSPANILIQRSMIAEILN